MEKAYANVLQLAQDRHALLSAQIVRQLRLGSIAKSEIKQKMRDGTP